MGFATPVDIANRAIQHLGARRIVTFADASRQAAETNFCYDKLRLAELRRSVWRFATRRAILRPLTSTCLRYVPPVWASGTTYAAGQIVQDSSGIYWISTVGSNLGNTPGTMVQGTPPFWVQYFGPVIADIWAARTGTDTYSAGEIVYKAGPTFYINTANGVTSADPASGTPWAALVAPTSSPAITLIEPAGPGMTVNSLARNMFPLPNGYLRVAGPDPRSASTSRLETSGALRYQDWQFEGDYLISSSTTAILMRFVADVSHVPSMDALFCEALGARIAYETCEIITQSNVKLQAIAQAYQKFIRDARLVNWIESGSTEPQEEEYELTKGPQGVVESGGGQPQMPQEG